MTNACNIGNTERIARIVFGVILFLGAIFNFGREFLFLVAIVLMVEGFLGLCGIPLLVEKFKLHNIFKDKQP